MVEFQELKIAPGGQELIIDVSVKDLKYYTDVYLDTILIDTQDTFVEYGPSKDSIIKGIFGKDYQGNFTKEDFKKSTGLGAYTLNYPSEASISSINSISILDSDDALMDGNLFSHPCKLLIYANDHTIEKEMSYNSLTKELKAYNIPILIKDGQTTINSIDIDIVDSTGKHWRDYILNAGGDSYTSKIDTICTMRPFVKRAKVVIDKSELPDLNNNLFFVYVKTKGTPAANTPCGMDNITTAGAVYNEYKVESDIVCNMYPKMEEECSIPKKFIDAILLVEALNLNIKSGKFNNAIWYFSKLKKAYSTTGSKCGCYG